MEADFWHGMWASGKIGFHQADINTYLKSHWSQLALHGYALVKTTRAFGGWR